MADDFYRMYPSRRPARTAAAQLGLRRTAHDRDASLRALPGARSLRAGIRADAATLEQLAAFLEASLAVEIRRNLKTLTDRVDSLQQNVDSYERVLEGRRETVKAEASQRPSENVSRGPIGDDEAARLFQTHMRTDFEEVWFPPPVEIAERDGRLFARVDGRAYGIVFPSTSDPESVREKQLEGMVAICERGGSFYNKKTMEFFPETSYIQKDHLKEQLDDVHFSVLVMAVNSDDGIPLDSGETVAFLTARSNVAWDAYVEGGANVAPDVRNVHFVDYEGNDPKFGIADELATAFKENQVAEITAICAQRPNEKRPRIPLFDSFETFAKNSLKKKFILLEVSGAIPPFSDRLYEKVYAKRGYQRVRVLVDYEVVSPGRTRQLVRREMKQVPYRGGYDSGTRKDWLDYMDPEETADVKKYAGEEPGVLMAYKRL